MAGDLSLLGGRSGPNPRPRGCGLAPRRAGLFWRHVRLGTEPASARHDLARTGAPCPQTSSYIPSTPGTAARPAPAAIRLRQMAATSDRQHMATVPIGSSVARGSQLDRRNPGQAPKSADSRWQIGQHNRPGHPAAATGPFQFRTNHAVKPKLSHPEVARCKSPSTVDKFFVNKSIS